MFFLILQVKNEFILFFLVNYGNIRAERCFMKFYLVIIFAIFACHASNADVLDLETALQNTYRACVDIDKAFVDMKKMTAINTAVTGVGTGVGIGAVATGLVKSNVDKKIEQWEKKLDEMILAQKNSNLQYQHIDMSDEDIAALFAEDSTYKTLSDSISTAEKRSKKLGNWRTGLLAGNTLTHLTSAVITNQNKLDTDLLQRINQCKDSLKTLQNSITQARMDGIDTQEAKHIYDVCIEYEYIDLSPIKRNTTGVMVSSIVGAVASGAGTVTSAVANSDKIRQDDNSKEQKLNKVSNILSVGGTVASAGATVFNAAQIAAIKKIITVSENCTKVLK